MAPAPPGTATEPLWTAADLAAATGGAWLRAPGARWRPRRLTGSFGPRLPAGTLAGALVFVRGPARLAEIRRLTRGARPPALAGLILAADAAAPALDALPGLPLLAVERPLEALHALAFAARDRMAGPLVAISGTVGKTTTRRMLTHILARRGSVATNRGDLNYAGNIYEQMASTPRATDYAVFELGLGAGRDSFLRASTILEPDLVMLTQAGPAHIDSLTDAALDEPAALRLVADQKLQLASTLRPGGAVILNAAIPIAGTLADELRREGRRVLTYAMEGPADAALLGLRREDYGWVVEAALGGRRVTVRLGPPGLPVVENGLGAMLAATELGIDAEAAARALDSYEGAEGRATVVDLAFAGRRVRLIDDSFNATPLSVRASLALLRETASGRSGRAIAVLGDIAHLGRGSAAIHAGLAATAADLGVDLVCTMGHEMAHLQHALPPPLQGGHFADHAGVVEALLSFVADGDVVAVKASMPLRFGTLVRMLRARADPPARRAV